MRWAAPPAVAVVVWIQSPAFSEALLKVTEPDEVVPSRQVWLVDAIAQAAPPEAAVAKLALVRLAVEPPRRRCRRTVGVPASARTLISTIVAAAGI